MRLGTLKKLPGLNRKQIAVDTSDVQYLTTVDNDDKSACNIHFRNGHWVTAALTVSEAMAVIESEDKQDNKDQLERWKKTAEIKRQMQLDVDSAMKMSSIDCDKWEKCGHNIVTEDDGTKTITIRLQRKILETQTEVQGEG